LLRLAKLATGGLLEFARLAAARKDAALAGLVVDEVEDRERFGQGNARHVAREERRAITALLNSVPTEAEEVTPMLDEMQTLAREALVASGHAKSVDKIALGLVKQQQGGTADDDDAAAAQA
jgi:heme exporter protein D